MHNGKTPIYTELLVASLPYETVAWLCDEGGIVNFRARKHPRSDTEGGESRVGLPKNVGPPLSG